VRISGDGVAPGPPRLRVTGDYDGTVLHVTEAPAEVPDPDFGGLDFPVPCAEPAGGWPPFTGHELSPITTFPGQHPDRYAGLWLGEGAVFVVGIPRGTDVAAAEAELRALDPTAPLCVTEMEHSTATLDAAQRGASDLLQASGATVRGSSTDVLDNRVVFTVWRVDQATLDAIDAQWGDTVAVFPEFVVLDRPLAGLPEPTRVDEPNAVALVTEPFPGTVYLTALASPTLQYDAALDCFYFGTGDNPRTLPVWRYGTTATRTPAEIIDSDGRVIWRVGETFDIGGGGGSEPPDAATSCGATEVWLVGRLPEPRT
jgi:hypothetical protein